jgi:hypothetical protein
MFYVEPTEQLMDALKTGKLTYVGIFSKRNLLQEQQAKLENEQTQIYEEKKNENLEHEKEISELEKLSQKNIEQQLEQNISEQC